MAIQQDIDLARESAIGPHGISDTALNGALARSEGALKTLLARHADGDLRLLHLPAERGDIAAMQAAATRLTAGATDIVFLGTGGSRLGGQTLAQLAGHAVPGVGTLRAGPRLHFMDNLDPLSFGGLLAKLPLATTRFVAISKSGGTGETLMQTAAALSACKDAGLTDRIPQLFFGLSEPAKPGKRNGLRELLGAFNVSFLDHETGVGGRFSVLTNVGLLPAAVLGLDIAAIREGAGAALAPVLAKRPAEDVPAALGHPITLFVEVELVSETAPDIDAAKSSFVAAPEVQQCYYVTGEVDFMLVVLVPSMTAYEALTRRLFFADANIRKFRTFVAMDRVKAGLAVPVG